MTGIICAMHSESDALEKRMKEPVTVKVGRVEFKKGIIEGQETVIAVCGVGKVFAAVCTQTMILTFNPDEIINLGVAGGLVSSLSVTDIVIGESVCQYDMDTSALGDPVGMISGVNMIYFPCDAGISVSLRAAAEKLGLHAVRGIIASGDRFVGSSDMKKYIRDTFSASACEMEGGAVGQVCYVAGVPFCVLRSISDGGDEDAQMSFAAFTEKAAANGTAVLQEYLRTK